MVKQIFINLPVKDLQKSITFFTALGFTFNPQFTNENATCMILGENMFAMLLAEPYFASFIKQPISDAKKSSEVLVALSLDSRPAADDMVARAVAGGGNTYRDPQDHGFMYTQGFQDLDGHIWEPFFMDMSQFPGA